MRELRDMMNDFALIVQRQGDQLDTIEGNVDTAQDSVEAGQKHLQKAIQYSKKSRKWQCCCLIIALVVIAAILFPILINVGGG